jgi:hypothetical protein
MKSSVFFLPEKQKGKDYLVDLATQGGLFPGSKAAEAWSWPSTPSSAAIKEKSYTSPPALSFHGTIQGEL